MARNSAGIRRWNGRSLHPELADLVRDLVEELREDGIPARITSGYRSLAEQRRLYRAYQRGGPLAAQAGASAHNYGLAVDVAISGAERTDRRYRKLHKLAREYGLETLSGSQLVADPYHLQVPNWRRYVP